jgi:hypothetical protein
MIEYVVRNKSGVWMGTYSSLLPDALALAKQCARRSEGSITESNSEAEEDRVIFPYTTD